MLLLLLLDRHRAGIGGAGRGAGAPLVAGADLPSLRYWIKEAFLTSNCMMRRPIQAGDLIITNLWLSANCCCAVVACPECSCDDLEVRFWCLLLHTRKTLIVKIHIRISKLESISIFPHLVLPDLGPLVGQLINCPAFPMPFKRRT